MFGRSWQLVVDLGLVKAIALVDNDGVVKVFEYIHDTTSVPIIGDSATVVYMPGRVFEYFERCLRVLH